MFQQQPWRGLELVDIADCDIAILGIPFDGAVSASRGAAAAPERIRVLSGMVPPFAEERIDLRQLKIADRGNISLTQHWERLFDDVGIQATQMLREDCFSLFLGGDHSATIPLVKAFAARYAPAPVGIIHFDSHCDLMNEYDGHHWSHACIQRRSLEQKNIAAEHLTLVGIRSYEAEEAAFLQDNPAINVIGARQLYHQGHSKTVEQICSSMAQVSAIYFSLDIDVLDPAFAPGTGTPEGGGLSTRDLLELSGALLSCLPIKAMDIVEVSPPLDHADITSWAAVKIIYELFGKLAQKKA
ncbi:MAG TPA: agmatinase [Candidatus Limnocylindrales bacterium]|nr:agmatinase [Candidatus Limnocylindrales bacterium]